MKGTFKAIYLVGTSSVGKDGKIYRSVTLMSGDTVMKLSCDDEAYVKLEGKEMKEVTLIIKLSEYNNIKNARVVGVA